MKRVLIIAAFSVLALNGMVQIADARRGGYVRSYTKKDGTYVSGHYRRGTGGYSGGGYSSTGGYSGGTSYSNPSSGGATITSASSPAQTASPSATDTTIYGNPADAQLDTTSGATKSEVSDNTTLARTGGEPVWMVAFGSLIAFGALALRRRLQ